MGKSGTLRIAIVGDNSKLDQSLKGAGDMIGGFAKGAAGILAGGGVLAGAAFVGGMMEAFSRDADSDKIAAALGLTGADADRLGSIAGDVWSDAFGDSIGEVNTALEGVISTLGGFADLGEEGVDRLTRKALTLADVWNVDVGQAISAAGTLLASDLVDDADEAFDLLARGMQEMPAHLREELFEASTEYGKFFRDLGIEGSEAFALLVRGAEDGMYGIDKTGDAIKEFTIRATDMSTATSDAYESIGLDARTMANDILEGGETARGAFQTIVQGLADINNPADQAAAAVALFGTPLEDLSVSEIPALLQSLLDMQGGLGDVEGALDDAGDTAYDNLKTKWDSAMRGAAKRFYTFADEEIIPRAEKIMEAFDERGIGGAVEEMGELWEQAWPEIENWLSTDVVPWITDEFAPAVGEAMLDAGVAAGKKLVAGLWEGVKDLPDFFNYAMDNPIASDTPIWDRGVRSEGGTFGSGSRSTPAVPFRHAGGEVPGAPGTTVPIWAQAGETITRASDAAAPSAGPNVTVIVQGNVLTEGDLADNLIRELERRRRLTAGAS